MELAASGGAILILGVEAEVYFHPHEPEQLVNACRRAGFATVYRGVLGDELVAEEYRRLWNEANGGTIIRSTCPVVVDTVRRNYPDLVKYLAPVQTPVQAEAAYVRAKHGSDQKIVYGGVCLTEGGDMVDATITLQELEELLRVRGGDISTQPNVIEGSSEVRRRHLSTAGGLPLPVLQEEPQASVRFRKMRGLGQLDTIAQALSEDGVELGFVDLLPCEGCLDHPLLGPREELFKRRRIVQAYEPSRSPEPVTDPGYEIDVTTGFEPVSNGHGGVSEAQIEDVIRRIGTAPNGSHWDCGACGFDTCRKFATAHVKRRATLRQCLPHQELRAIQAHEEAAVDELTGLATYRVLRDRLRQEVARARRTGGPFAVLFADMDRFKNVNDSYGHQAGNEVLEMVAGVLAKTVRGTDMAARFGGDEFVVLLIATDAKGARKVGEEVRQLVEQAGIEAGYPPGMVTVSVGVAPFENQLSGQEVLAAADKAQYGAKSSGGNRVVWVHDEQLSIGDGLVPAKKQDTSADSRAARTVDRSRSESPKETPWGSRRAEALIASLKGVVSVRVVETPGGEISEIHVLAETEFKPKQIVRNVESALLAQLGIELDHRKISVAQTADTLPIEVMEEQLVAERARKRAVVFRSVEVAPTKTPHRVSITVTVVLANEDEPLVAREESGDAPQMRVLAAARAAVSILNGLMAEGTVDLAGAHLMDAFDSKVVLVGLHVLEARGTRIQVGSCVIRGSVEQAAVLAVLDAGDRQITY
jgi:diguanylate cyclase (GGDEF)-like protein